MVRCRKFYITTLATISCMLWKKQIVFMEFDLSTNVSNVTLQKKAKSPVYLKCHTKQSLGIDLKKC